MARASTIQERVLHRALLVLGGLPNLSRYLLVSEQELMDWLGGFGAPPHHVFSDLCTLVERSEGYSPPGSDRHAGA